MNPPLTGPLLLRRDALLRGYMDDEIARERRRGSWSQLQRGAYLVGDPQLGRRARHALRVRATVSGLRRAAVVSHASAAVLHGLPLWGLPLTTVHVTREPPARSGRGSRLTTHVARLPDGDTAAAGGLPVTSVARTVLDLARSLPFAPALCVADCALREGGTTPDELRTLLDRDGARPGDRSARRVVAQADGRSESVGESRSRAVMLQIGLELPDLQVEVHTPGGRFVGRADFGWRRHRLLGEFDGRVKYGRLLRRGQTPGDAVWEEKRREDALRDEGWRMVRWVWSELQQPPVLGQRIHRHLVTPS